MLLAQWMPRNEQNAGPISTGPAVSLLMIGGSAVALGAVIVTASVEPYRVQPADTFASTGRVTITDPCGGAQVCTTIPANPADSRTVMDGACQ